jgi:predicted Zn-dependent peptidase
VAIFKEHGTEKSSPKIQKPPITPIKVNRDSSSTFAGEILAKPSEKIEPSFLDYRKAIGFYAVTPDIGLHYLQNRENDLFSIYYVFDIGKNHSRKIDLALDYLSYLGTSSLTPAQFSQELYRNGASFSAFTSEDYVYLKLSGLQKNFPASIRLLEQLLTDAEPDEAALKKLKAGTMKERADDKLSKRKILFEAMSNYGKYGPSSPFNNVLSNAELESVSSGELLEEIGKLLQYRHRVLYYGPASAENLLGELHTVRRYPEKLSEPPAASIYPELEQKNNLVYVVDYDMTQAEVIMLSRDDLFDASMLPMITLFNEYYGGGMSSVVFQELREAKALAYSVLSVYRTPKLRDRHNYIFSYIGTQADKLPEALEGIRSLMLELPESPELFASAKNGIMQKIASERLTRTEVLFNYEDARRLGLDEDIRKEVFDRVPGMGLEDVQAFHRKHFGNRNHVMLVLGDTARLDMQTLRKYGEVRELKLEELFGY